MNSYYKVIERTTCEIIIKKSRFITTLVPITDSEHADNELKQIRKQYSDATHNCYCYIGGANTTVGRFSDDGEPQGTAGVPMLEVLKKRGVFLTLAVVTRYFGGVKLGANGLVSAYIDSVSTALDKALDTRKVQQFIYSIIASFHIDYALYDGTIEIITSNGGRIDSTDYGVDVEVHFAVDEQLFVLVRDKLIDYSLGRINIIIIGDKYIGYDI